MSDYPRRGEMSEDGNYYTHTDGSVHEVEIGVANGCHVCSVGKTKNECYALCSWANHFRLVEGAYVQSDEEREACDMARKMIALCSDMADCNYCLHIEKKSCPARAYLAEHGCADAWEVKP